MFGRSRGGRLSILNSDVAVLDHLAFRKKNHLSAAQDFSGQKCQQARVIVGHRPTTPQELGELVAALEKPVRGDATAVSSCRLVNEVLRNYRFEAREVIE